MDHPPSSLNQTLTSRLPPYAAPIEDLGRGDFVRSIAPPAPRRAVDAGGAVEARAARRGEGPRPQRPVRCRGCRGEGVPASQSTTEAGRVSRPYFIFGNRPEPSSGRAAGTNLNSAGLGARWPGPAPSRAREWDHIVQCPLVQTHGLRDHDCLARCSRAKSGRAGKNLFQTFPCRD